MGRPPAANPGASRLRRRVPVHVVVCTHTTRYLAACLAALARQTAAPSSITISCDVEDAQIAALLDTLWPELAARSPRPTPVLIHVSRRHQRQARLNQVRNNALRALDAIVGPGDGDLVVMLDGDTLLEEHAVERHAHAASRGARIVIPYRINLDEARSLGLTPEAIAGAPSLRALARPAETDSLRRRERRYRLQLLARRLAPERWPLVKPHKPKILGGHHAVTIGALRAVNGYDEQYTGYGYDDDDLSRRLFALRPPPAIAVAVSRILAFHLWHPSRAPARPTQASGYARFCRDDLPIAAERGWRSPMAQPEPRVRIVSPGRGADAGTATASPAIGASARPAPRVGAA